jgi:molecular chaperone GrpE
MNNHGRSHQNIDGDSAATRSNPEGSVAEEGAAHKQSLLEAENAALRDQLLRALADVDNTRRQAERSSSDTRKYAIGEFAREMLGVSDSLQRAIAAVESRDRSEADESLIEGVRATGRMLASVFERFGLRRIVALGEPFDPNVHEAMMEVDDAASPPGTVARVLEEGYSIHDRLVRPARVAVVRRRPGPPNDEAGIHPSRSELHSVGDGRPAR